MAEHVLLTKPVAKPMLSNRKRNHGRENAQINAVHRLKLMETSLTQPALQPKGNDKIWSMLSHLSALFGMVGIGIILPLVVYLAMRQESEYLAQNAKEALNFHISILIYSICCIPLVFIVIGIPMLILIGVGSLVLSIIATIKASEGGCYHYPLTLRLVQ
jgi:uncharacterized protein